MQAIWYEKYRPKKRADYVFKNNDLRIKVDDWIEKKTVPHLCIVGPSGTGKTALAGMLLREIGVEDQDIMFLNASIENNVDTVRSKILSFCEGGGWSGMRTVVLDESDNMSLASQKMLRGVMDQYADSVRFILTCNYPRRIEPAIVGRCKTITLDALSTEEMAMRMIAIFDAEGNPVTDDALAIIADIATRCSPNLRQAINEMQEGTIGGVLHRLEAGASGGDEWESSIDQALTKGLSVGQLRVVLTAMTPEDMNQVFQVIYTNATRYFGDKEAQAIHVIATFLARHSTCMFPEINIMDLVLELMKLRVSADDIG